MTEKQFDTLNESDFNHPSNDWLSQAFETKQSTPYTPAATSVQNPTKDSKENKIKKNKKIKNNWIVKISGFFAVISLIIALSFFGVMAFASYTLTDKINSINGNSLSSLNLLNLIPAATNAVTGNTTPLKGQSEGRTNFLLVGLDPDNGATDTLLIASLYHKENKISTVNIPRDFYINDPQAGSTKINAVFPIMRNSSGNAKKAMEYLVNFISQEFNIPVHYWFSINVNGLRQAIDLVGGVDVTVDRGFTDCQFPTDGYTGFITPCPTFKEGTENMNGMRASIYARSRHSADPLIGSDFNRTWRQSQVIQALITKIKNMNLWENITKIKDYLKILGDNLMTNTTIEDLISLGNIAKKMNLKEDYLKATWSIGNGFLCSPQNSPAGSIIGYGDANNCGNFYGGSRSSNFYKTTAQKYVDNLLKSATDYELKQTAINILSGVASRGQTNSTVTANLVTQLSNQGFYNVGVTNNFRPLASTTTPATSTTAATTSKTQTQRSSSTTPAKPTHQYQIYIQDPAIKKLFNNSNIVLQNINLEFIDDLPDNVKSSLPKNINLSKEIVILVRSVN
jgi:polyisoprenyl-teichoic acid--peptidoglycan teichoic acid transferase